MPSSPRTPRTPRTPQLNRVLSNSSTTSNNSSNRNTSRSGTPNTVLPAPRQPGKRDALLGRRLRYQAELKPFFRDVVTCDGVKSLVAHSLGSGKFGSVFRIKGPAALAKLFEELGIAVKPLGLLHANRRALPPAQKGDNHYNKARPLVELFMLMLMSQEAEKGNFPHFPLVYSVSMCGQGPARAPNAFPALTRHRQDVALVFTELADGDLASWLKHARPANAMASAVAQSVLALFAFRAMGFEHNDAHAKNILYHSVPPGGYWHYKLYGKDVYIQNCGHLFVLWDPMTATHALPNGQTHDVQRLAVSIGVLTSYDRTVRNILGQLVEPTVPKRFPGVVTAWLDHLGALQLDAVRIGPTRRPAPAQVLNRPAYRFNGKPFSLNANNASAGFARLFKQYSGTSTVPAP